MRILVQANQFILWLVVRLYLIISFSDLNVQLDHRLISANSGYLLAANHQNLLDPFLICAALPFRSMIKLSPVQFMAYKELFDHQPMRAFLRSCGAFPTKPGANLDYGLPFSSKALAAHGTIGIFPEGRRMTGERIEARRGVSVLAAEPHVDVILCHIQWSKSVIPRLSISISAPASLAGQSAQDILDQIYRLA